MILRRIGKRVFYVCDECGWEGESEWTDDEARAEQEQGFPGLRPEHEAIVCDDCYKRITGERTP